MDLSHSTIGAYELLEPLGVGGMGIVYRARHTGSGRMVALKTVRQPNEGTLASLRREIHALARLRHPRIVPILDEGVHEGVPWYAMALLDGVPLLQAVRHDAGWTPGAAGKVEPTATWIGGAAPPDAPSEEHESELIQEPLRDEKLASTGALRQAQGERKENDPRPDPRHFLHRALSLVRRLCAPLAFLHGEGVVHRDLKPDNILVVRSGHWAGNGDDGLDGSGFDAHSEPVIVDFGLAVHFASEVSRESLDVGDLASGTVAYMAPEQINSEQVDARADLYALGCILYELVCGRPPFTSSRRAEVLFGHLRTNPEPPSRLVPDLPAELETLILRLLSKDRRQRLGHADAVAAVLARLGAEDAPPERLPRPRPYLYRPSFWGRELELQQLEKHVQVLRSGHGALVLLGGESGIGKTRLAKELGRRSAVEGVRVMTGESEREGRAPLGPLRQPLRQIADRCFAQGLEETERLLGARGPLLASYEPAFRDLPGQAAQPSPAELPAEAARLRLFVALGDVFEALGSETPLMLLLDDLQRADELTLGWLAHLVRTGRLEGMPLLVLGTYRSDEVGPALADLIQAGSRDNIRLERLDAGAVIGMSGEMLALDPTPPRLSDFLLSGSEGNPFFVAEYLRAAVDRGLLRRDEQGRWHTGASVGADETDYDVLGLPRSLLELVQGRLADLPGAAEEAIAAAAVLGRETDMTSLEALAAGGLEGLGELLRRQLMEEVVPGRLRFTHDKIREVAYAGIDAPRRTALHLAAAKRLEAARTTDLATLGRHWQHAGVLDRARICYLGGARYAAERFAHEEAERLYRAYLRLAEAPTSESVEARNELGERVLALSGRNADAAVEFEQAIREARQIGDRAQEARGLRELGIVLRGTGDVDAARERLETALEIHRQSNTPAGVGSVLGELAKCLRVQGRSLEALPLYQQALDLHRQTGDRTSEGMVLTELAAMAQAQGRLDEAQTLYEQVLALHRAGGRRRLEAYALGHLASLHFHRGLLDRARELFEESLVAIRQVGDRRNEGVSMGNLASLYALQDRADEARELFQAAIALSRQTGDRRSEGIALGNLGNLETDLGRYEEALPHHQRALLLLRQVQSPLYEGITLGNMADALRDQGRTTEARDLYQQALAIAVETGNLRSQGTVLGHLAQLELVWQGDAALAEELAHRAEETLTAAQDSIELLQVLCLQGHVALALHHNGREALRRVEEAAETAAGQPGAILPKWLHGRVATLRRAVEAMELDEAASPKRQLVRGLLLEDLPAEVRRRLTSGD